MENFSKMPLRKVADVLGLTYSATAEQIEAVIPEIRDAIKATEGDRSLFRLGAFRRIRQFLTQHQNSLLYKKDKLRLLRKHPAPS